MKGMSESTDGGDALGDANDLAAWAKDAFATYEPSAESTRRLRGFLQQQARKRGKAAVDGILTGVSTGAGLGHTSGMPEPLLRDVAPEDLVVTGRDWSNLPARVQALGVPPEDLAVFADRLWQTNANSGPEDYPRPEMAAHEILYLLAACQREHADRFADRTPAQIVRLALRTSKTLPNFGRMLGLP